jgi:hypothetical protein
MLSGMSLLRTRDLSGFPPNLHKTHAYFDPDHILKHSSQLNWVGLGSHIVWLTTGMRSNALLLALAMWVFLVVESLAPFIMVTIRMGSTRSCYTGVTCLDSPVKTSSHKYSCHRLESHLILIGRDKVTQEHGRVVDENTIFWLPEHRLFVGARFIRNKVSNLVETQCRILTSDGR